MIPKGDLIACDTETTGLYSWTGCRPFCFTFCNESGDTGSFFWNVDPKTRRIKIKNYEYLLMKMFYENPKISKVFHNSKFDIRMLDSIGIKVCGKIEDTYFASRILRSNEPMFGLKALAKKYLEYDNNDEIELKKIVLRERLRVKKLGWKIAEKGDQGDNAVAADYWLAPREIVLRYAIGDVERTMLLWKIFRVELEKDKTCKRFYSREIQLQKVTYKMESLGIRVRVDKIKSEIEVHKKIMEESLRDLKKETNEKFNPNSEKQVAFLIYDKLKFPVRHWTDKGQPSTDSTALAEIEHPLVRILQKYRASNKANSTFFEKFLVNSVKGLDGQYVLHPEFDQIRTKTSRYSCRNPNIQNVADSYSTRSGVPIQARTPFCPRYGHVWISADYVGEELWIFADASKEKLMLSALYEERDLHQEVAEEIWGKELVKSETDQGLKTSRAKAKMLNFGIIYGMGVRSCSEFLKISEPEAEEILNRYYKIYPRIKPFMESMILKCKENGYIETAWGRKIWMDRDLGYRAVNYYVQGTAADVIKEAMLRLDSYLEAVGFGEIIMTIHDEIIIEVEKENLSQEFIKNIKEIMEDHQCHLQIKKLPVEVCLIKKQWNLKEEIPYDEKLQKYALQ